MTHFKIFKIYTRARGREQFTVTRDFIPFTLEVLQSKYLLFLLYLNFFKGWNKFATSFGWLGWSICLDKDKDEDKTALLFFSGLGLGLGLGLGC